MSLKRSWLYGALAVLYLLHNDLWLWDDPDRVLGLPVGLTYHIGYMLAVTVVMLLLVRHAWPEHLEVQEEVGGETRSGATEGETTRRAPDGTVPRRSDPGTGGTS